MNKIQTMLSLLFLFSFKTFGQIDDFSSGLFFSTAYAEEYNDEAINKATAAMISEAKRVRDETESVRRQTEAMTKAAQAVSATAREANQKATSMRAEVGLVKANTQATIEAKARSAAVESAAKLSHDKNLREIEDLKKEFAAIVQEAYNVEMQQKFIDEAQRDLTSFAAFLAQYYANHDQLPGFINEALALEKQADAAHTKWMDDLAALIEEKKPNFDNIVDFTTMFEEVQKIVSFENSLPISTGLLTIEGKTKTSLTVARNRANSLKTDNFNLVGMRGLHITLNGTNFKERLQEFYAIEVNLAETLRYINALEYMLEQKNERRNYLVRMIPIVWNRIANLRLQAANVTDGARIINEIDSSLRGPQIFASIKNRSASFKSEIDNQLRYNFAPYSAYQTILGAQANFQAIEKDLNEANLTNNMKVEINAMLMDEKAAVAARNNDVTLILSGSDFSRYISQWKSQARLIANRNQSKFNASCRDLYTEVLAITAFNKGTEQLFLSFKGACS